MEKYRLFGFVILISSTLTTSEAFLSSFIPYLSENRNNCPLNYFECNTGECIPKEMRCDSRVDCKDMSDEKDCGELSTVENLQSLNVWLVDVFHCTAPLYFLCKNARCVKNSLVCDGENDCLDFSDEVNCTSQVRIFRLIRYCFGKGTVI